MWTSLVIVAAAAALVAGHGRVLDPPGRGTAWRSGYNARANYDDDGLNCGGFARQHQVNGGKCGLCGDAYDDALPRPHERGGIYDSGLVVGSYEEGQIITITVQITAHHLGYWEFKLCPDSYGTTQECFDENLLELEDGGTKYYPENGSTKYYVNYRLPEGLTCENCVLQWKYTCGNNWGVCDNGTQGLGCGDQETFGACSDISISGNSNSHQYIPVDSLLLTKLEELGLVRLLINGAMVPQRWIDANTIQYTQESTASKPYIQESSDTPHKKGSTLNKKGSSAPQPYNKGSKPNKKGSSSSQTFKKGTKKQRINSKQPQSLSRSKLRKKNRSKKRKAKWMASQSWG